MKIIICGAGQVGFQIARHLSYEGHNITVIDQSPLLIRRVTDALDVSGVVGFASYPETLARAGAEDTDMLLAATASDEVNMTTCQVAHSLFGIPQKIARIRASDYLKTQWNNLFQRENMPVDVIISPEVEVAQAVLNRLDAPATFDSALFFDNKAQFLGIQLQGDCPLLNTSLGQLKELFGRLQVTIFAVKRDQIFFIPTKEDQLFEGDDIYILSSKADSKRVLELFGQDVEQGRHIIIIGGGSIGFSVAKALEESEGDFSTRLIEFDPKRAETIAEKLERTIILNGDGLNESILIEANASKAEAVISLTNDDKINLLSCGLAKHLGAHRVMALTNDLSFSRLADALKINAFINPKMITVSRILKYVRRGRVRDIHSLLDGQAELIELQVLATSPIVDKKLSEIDFPADVHVCAVMSDKEVFIPRPDYRFIQGDCVVIFAVRHQIKSIEKLFRVSVNFI
jgi:trk system potassium uptake protein